MAAAVGALEHGGPRAQRNDRRRDLSGLPGPRHGARDAHPLPPAPARRATRRHARQGDAPEMNNETVNVRYMVNDVDDAVAFYTTMLDFHVLSNAAPAFADVQRGNLRLLLAGPKSSAGRPMPDGRQPEPGGWNRMHFIVADIASEVERLRTAGIRFRNEIISGPGGQQILLEDPAGNPIELFQPAGG